MYHTMPSSGALAPPNHLLEPTCSFTPPIAFSIWHDRDPVPFSAVLAALTARSHVLAARDAHGHSKRHTTPNSAN